MVTEFFSLDLVLPPNFKDEETEALNMGRPVAAVCGGGHQGQGQVLRVSDCGSSALERAELGASSGGCSPLPVTYSWL